MPRAVERDVGGPPADLGRAAGQRGLDVGGRQLAQTGQGPQCGRLHAGVGVGPGRAGPAATSPLWPATMTRRRRRCGAAFGALIRGNIVAHLPSMSEPDASADGEAAANPITSDAGPIGAARCHRPLSWPAGALACRARDRPGRSLVVAALIAGRISVNYYVITPGDATPVARYIEVPAVDNHPLTGKILLTDVFVTQLNAFS